MYEARLMTFYIPIIDNYLGNNWNLQTDNGQFVDWMQRQMRRLLKNFEIIEYVLYYKLICIYKMLIQKFTKTL